MPLTLLGDVRQGQHRGVVEAGISLPTGSIDERDDTPAGPAQKLPYPMQLGSGTVDLLLRGSYLGETGAWGWSGQAKGAIRVGQNANGYDLGNRLHLTAWLARRWTRWLSFSTQLEGQLWGNIDGADPDLQPALVPTADPRRRGGERVDVAFGMDLYAPGGALEGNRLPPVSGDPARLS